MDTREEARGHIEVDVGGNVPREGGYTMGLAVKFDADVAWDATTTRDLGQA